MYTYPEIYNGSHGGFHRIQLVVKYTFGYHNTVANKKK